MHDRFHVEATVSRPFARAGGTLVGTIRVTHKNGDTPAAVPLRECLRSLELCLVGQCRLDPRWHNIKERTRQYQQTSVVAPSNSCVLLRTLPTDENTFLFWATQPIELLQLQERQEGQWEVVRPKSLLIHDDNKQQQQQQQQQQDTLEASPPLKATQLAFSFRTLLPCTLPHSLSTTSCRYSYHIIVRLHSTASNTPQWTRIPFIVLSNDPEVISYEPFDQGPAMTVDQLHVTALHAMAHSSGLPCGLGALELCQPGGVLIVNRHGPSHYRQVKRKDDSLQTLRVADPQGRPVCVMTLLGATTMYPGSRLLIKFDFTHTTTATSSRSATTTTTTTSSSSSDDWVPCHLVAACLQGEEIAIRHDQSMKRSKTHIFDTSHAFVDASIDRVTLNLALPLDAPCSLTTDVVAINTRCLVDISVTNERQQRGGLQNLRLEVPCNVFHSIQTFERAEHEDQNDTPAGTVDELLGMDLTLQEASNNHDPTDPASFPWKDIVDELKVLSSCMAKQCGLTVKGSPTRL